MPIVGHTDLGISIQDCLICGPTIVVRRDQQPGEFVFCRHCGSKLVIDLEDVVLRAKPTGERGTVSDLQHEVDVALIDDLVAESARGLSKG